MSFHLAATYIKQQIPDVNPRVGIILGSGLGNIVDAIKNRRSLFYRDIPGFPQPKIAGHGGQLYLGQLGGTAVACLQGRSHLYEGTRNEVIINLVRTLHQLGCQYLVITNAAGSLRIDMPTGSLMLINDHINLQFNNVLVGCFGDEYGSPFINMLDAYCPEMRQSFLTTAQQQQIDLLEGVYIGVLGPSFETPAEIRAFSRLGADAVGMSTIPEVIVARHCGMHVAAISVITNLAAGLSQEQLSHEHTLYHATQSSEKLKQLIVAFLQQHTLTSSPCQATPARNS